MYTSGENSAECALVNENLFRGSEVEAAARRKMKRRKEIRRDEIYFWGRVKVTSLVQYH